MLKIEKLSISSSSEIPYRLLLSADPSKAQIDTYIYQSEIFIAHFHDELVGCYVLCPISVKVLEIKNIAVDAAHQGKGIGTKLLEDAIERATRGGAEKLVIGTGNSSLAQLYLYQKLGFRITGIKPNFFTRRYPEPIIENGLQCIDMLILTRFL